MTKLDRAAKRGAQLYVTRPTVADELAADAAGTDVIPTALEYVRESVAVPVRRVERSRT